MKSFYMTIIISSNRRKSSRPALRVGETWAVSNTTLRKRRRRNPGTWTFTDVPTQYLLDCGFTMHEHLDDLGLVNMNGRMYSLSRIYFGNPMLARFLSPDNYVQAPGYTQNLNRYSYALNNPLVYTDPDGEWVQYVIGAAIGGLSAEGGASIAMSAMPFANTAGIMFGSFTYSVGMHILSEGQTDVSISFGVGSYNFDTGEWNGIWNWNSLSTMEKIGYGLGALANLRDVNEIINSTRATLYTDNSDFISHSAIVDKNTGEPLMSFSPNDYKTPSSKLGYAIYFRKSTSDFHYNPTLPVDISVNEHAIDIVRGLGKVLPFQGITTNCVNMASLSLWLNGIPNIGLSPWVLYGTVSAYNIGVRPDLFSYYFTQYGR